MKKRVAIAILCVLWGAAGAYSGTEKRLTGLVIFAGVDSIEVKRGGTETTLYWSEGSKVTREGAEIGRSGVEVCQRVSVDYAVKEGRREVVSLDVLAGSYCAR